MKKWILLILLTFNAIHVNAQYIIAGDQPLNGYYYDIPDTTIGLNGYIFLDVNGDNINDIQIIQYKPSGAGNLTKKIIVKPLNNTEVAYGHYDTCSYIYGIPGILYDSLAKGINYLDTINENYIWSNSELMVLSYFICTLTEFSSDTNSINYIGIRTFNLQDTAYSYIKIRPYSTNFTIYEIASNLAFVGINSLEEELIDIYPNPINDKLTIKFPNPMQLHYSIININGQQIYNGEVFSNLINIDMSNLSKGIYLLRLKNDDSIITRKLIKE
jgi:hypothetical protein